MTKRISEYERTTEGTNDEWVIGPLLEEFGDQKTALLVK